MFGKIKYISRNKFSITFVKWLQIEIGHWTPFFYSSILISVLAPFLKAAACQGRLFARSRRKFATWRCSPAARPPRCCRHPPPASAAGTGASWSPGTTWPCSVRHLEMFHDFKIIKIHVITTSTFSASGSPRPTAPPATPPPCSSTPTPSRRCPPPVAPDPPSGFSVFHSLGKWTNAINVNMRQEEQAACYCTKRCTLEKICTYAHCATFQVLQVVNWKSTWWESILEKSLTNVNNATMRAFKCNQCNKTYKIKGDLTRHCRAHQTSD